MEFGLEAIGVVLVAFYFWTVVRAGDIRRKR